MRQEFLSQQLCVEPIEPLVSPTSKSTKGSCAAPPTLGDDINGQTKDCELLVVGGKLPRVVALGKVYQDATTLHNVPLSPDVGGAAQLPFVLLGVGLTRGSIKMIYKCGLYYARICKSF